MIKLTGKIKKIFDVETYNDFSKRVFWLEETVDKYANIFQIEVWKQDIEMLNNCKEGDFLTFYIDIKGKFWSNNGREGVINTLKAWNMEKDGKLFKQITNP